MQRERFPQDRIVAHLHAAVIDDRPSEIRVASAAPAEANRKALCAIDGGVNDADVRAHQLAGRAGREHFEKGARSDSRMGTIFSMPEIAMCSGGTSEVMRMLASLSTSMSVPESADDEIRAGDARVRAAENFSRRRLRAKAVNSSPVSSGSSVVKHRAERDR